MNREEIVRMARDAGCIEPAIPDWVIRTCALVASAEREACAQVCEHTAVRMGSEWMAHHCASAIRARGQA